MANYILDHFWIIIFMWPMRRLDGQGGPSLFLWGGGGRRGWRFFLGLGPCVIVPNVCQHGSHQVPTMFCKMFPLVAHFYPIFFGPKLNFPYT
jgi:hypothetical protein